MNTRRGRAFITRSSLALGGLALGTGCSTPSTSRRDSRNELTRDLVGHWPLRGDAQDHSGHGHHGVVHGAGPAEGQFDGPGSFIEVRPSDSLNLGPGDFTLSAWVWTAPDTEDVLGDIGRRWGPI